MPILSNIVPPGVMVKMLAKLEVPNVTETHSVEFLIREGDSS